MDKNNTKKVINIEQISSDIGIDLVTTIKLLKMLFPQTRQTNIKLRQAAKKGDYKEIVEFAHDIKGSCGNFRLMDIYETAAEIVKMGKNGDSTEEILKLSEKMDLMLDRYIEKVGKYDGSIKGSFD